MAASARCWPVVLLGLLQFIGLPTGANAMTDVGMEICPQNWTSGQDVELNCLVNRQKYPSKCNQKTVTYTPQFRLKRYGKVTVECEVLDVRSCNGAFLALRMCGCVDFNDDLYYIRYRFTATGRHNGMWDCYVPDCFVPGTQNPALTQHAGCSVTVTDPPTTTTTTKKPTAKPAPSITPKTFEVKKSSCHVTSPPATWFLSVLAAMVAAFTRLWL